MTRRKALITIAALCGILTMPSCSVKESRDVCPTVLDIWQENCYGQDGPMRVQVWDHDATQIDREVSREEFGAVYSTVIPKRTVICVVGSRGSSLGVNEGSAVRARQGSEFIPLWAGADHDIDATGEHAQAHLSLHRQHTRITLKFPHLEGHTISARINAGSGGVDIHTQKALEGTMEFTADQQTLYPQVSFLLPRMEEGSTLTATVYLDGVSTGRTLDLMRIITTQRDGFWSRTDLDNATISCDLMTGSAAIVVTPWDVVDKGTEII